MKLVFAIINDEDAQATVKLLNDRGHMVTKLATTGGFLRSGNTTLIVGIEDDKVQDVLDVFEKRCKTRKKVVGDVTPYTNIDSFMRYPIEVTVGGATIFVLDVEKFVKI